jgi:hypothetical protein
MPRKKETQVSPTDNEELFLRLVEAVERVGEGLGEILTVLDKLRDDFAWALSNDKFRPERDGVPSSWTAVPRRSARRPKRRSHLVPPDASQEEAPRDTPTLEGEGPSRQAEFW